MFDNIKIQKAVFAVLVLLSVFLLGKVFAEFGGLRYIGTNPQAQSIISVSGKGEVVGVPDIATFNFSVEKESLFVADAQSEVAKRTNDIIAFLKKSGIAEKDIKTSGYNIYPRYEYFKSTRGEEYPVSSEGKRELVAYVVTQSITVKVRALADAGKLLSGIGELGATNVSGLSFDFDKRDELVREARNKAISDARAEAEKLAKALGVRLVRIVSYNEGGGYPVYYAKAAEMSASGGSIQGVAQIPVGEDKLISQVSITYEIK
ncbi:MAG: SIMPL domain-containing protein [bacterium]|nr:SIMPL domain-containing protein [bacterium]